jgi:hypothetical protein
MGREVEVATSDVGKQRVKITGIALVAYVGPVGAAVAPSGSEGRAAAPAVPAGTLEVAPTQTPRVRRRRNFDDCKPWRRRTTARRLGVWPGRRGRSSGSTPAVKTAWGRGFGYRLMFLESEVLVGILQDLATRNIPALGLHDGLLVAVWDREVTKGGDEGG